jgi:hypothetical protein
MLHGMYETICERNLSLLPIDPFEVANLGQCGKTINYQQRMWVPMHVCFHI